MNKNRKKQMILAAVLSLCLFGAGCGCGKKETDPAKEQVLKITITPAPTPTTAPEELNSDAIITNDGVTMLNGYMEDASTSEKASSKSEDSQNVSSDTEDIDAQAAEDIASLDEGAEEASQEEDSEE